MRLIFPCSEVLETAQGLEVDLPVILAPCPTSLRVWTGGEQHAVSVAPQCGDGVQIEANDFLNILLLRIVAVHAMRGAARRQAMPRRTQLLPIEVDPGCFRVSQTAPETAVRWCVQRRRSSDSGCGS